MWLLPLNTEQWLACLVVGGNKLTYVHDADPPAANLLETKILVNSTISYSKKVACFCTLELKDYFLTLPMKESQCMHTLAKYNPPDILNQYDLYKKIHAQHVYCKINKGIRNLKQGALLVSNFSKKTLKPYQCSPIEHTTGLWHHYPQPIVFCLCLDDFGIKYFDKKDVLHLITTLQKSYTLSTDWTGSNYCGLM